MDYVGVRMTWLLPVLRSRVTWGVGIAVGVLIALAAHGRLKYRSGYADGIIAADARHATADRIARAEADSAWSVLLARSTATRDSIHGADLSVARASVRLATARTVYVRTRAALDTARAADTTRSPLAVACDEFRTACELRAAQSDAVIDSLTRAGALHRLLIARSDSLARTEPDRVQRAVVRGIVADRMTRRSPSRLRWLLTGAVVGLVAGLQR